MAVAIHALPPSAKTFNGSGEKMKIDAKSFGYRCAVRMVASLSGCTGVVIICYVTYLQGNTVAGSEQTSSPVEGCPAAGDRVITDLLKPIRQEPSRPSHSRCYRDEQGD